MKLILKYKDGDDYYCDVNRVMPIEADSLEAAQQILEKEKQHKAAELKQYAQRYQETDREVSLTIRRRASKEITPAECDARIAVLRPPFNRNTIFGIMDTCLLEAEVITLDEWFKTGVDFTGHKI